MTRKIVKIEQFQGEYRFLSNFYPCVVFLKGVQYPTVEHAYQAGKFRYQNVREVIRDCATPGQAKRKAHVLTLAEKYPLTENFRVRLMKRLLRQKFDRDLNPKLYKSLQQTGDADLVEGNRWGDEFWGVDLRSGKGRNVLGELLMDIRDG